MNHISNIKTRLAPHLGLRPPWLMFLFLAAVIFLVQHDLSYSKKGTDNYNPTEDDITAAVTEGSLTRRVALVSLGLFAIVSLIRQRANRCLRINGSLGWILLGFATWAFLSPIWAEVLGLTLRRLLVFAILCIAAVAIARRLSLREIMLWTFYSSALYLVVGVLAEVLLGTFRPFASGYRFAGTIDPNTQGANCALLLLSGVAAAKVEKHRRTFFRACALLGFVFLILTASRTSFAAALLALAAYLAAVCSKRAKILIAYALSIGFCLLLLVLGNGLLLRLRSAVTLGRDDSNFDSFNGRRNIWEDVSYYIDRRPILGYGYGGFWTPGHIAEISGMEKWGVPNGHSAYLDYLLMLGAVGLFAYMVSLLGGIWCAFRFQRLSRDSVFAFSGAVLVFCAFDGLLESGPISPSHLMFLTFVLLGRLAFVSPLEDTGIVDQRDMSIHM
jgi:exopolysaccharide production protein ExoQ